jgi:hypothetical protein
MEPMIMSEIPRDKMVEKLKPLLKDNGSGTAWYKTNDDIIFVFNVQGY